jgi:esterase/lipase superfamily enzyme
LILLVLFCCTVAPASAGVTLNGTVRDSRGKTVPGARITVVDSHGSELASLTSDDAGSFRIADISLPPGEYVLRVSGSGFEVVHKRFEITADGRIGSTSLDIVLSARVYKSAPPAGGSPPTPRPPPPAPREEPRERPQDRNYTRVRVFYATDRNTTGEAAPSSFYGGDRSLQGRLTYGTCEVSIPRHHEAGELEAPSIWRLEFRQDPGKHVVLMSVTEAEAGRFYSELQGRVAESGKREAFVFIHGYNVTFEDAARRTAQLSYDLKYDAAPVLYSWPSGGSTARYIQDEANVEWTVPHLRQFLSEVRSRSGADVVHLIAHSMGNRALVNALQTLPADPAGPRFQQIVLAAPDIDRDVFQSLAQKVIEQSRRVTLYSSGNDEALVASKTVHGYPRLGDSISPIFIHPGIDTIDVSAVKTDFLGHSYYGDSRTVLDDLVILLKEGLAPPRNLRRLTTPGIHWAMPAP